MNRTGSIASILVLLWAGPAAAAGLEFEAERVLVKATPADDVVEVKFRYHNRGRRAATIESVLSNCQCLDARAPEGKIASGATGELVGVFKVGVVQGVVEKGLMATVSDDDGRREVSLVAAVDVPEVIRVEPGTLFWKIGQDPGEQSVLVTAVWPENIRVRQLECSQQGFDLRVEVVEDGRRYRVFAKPHSTAEKNLALLQVHTDSRFAKYSKPMIFLSIGNTP